MKVLSRTWLKSLQVRWVLVGLCGLFLLAACQPITAPAATSSAAATPAAAAEPTYTAMAFVRDGVLYIQMPNGEATPVEDCTGICHIFHLTWSPDGSYLLYYWQPITAYAMPEIRLADHQGNVQTVTQNPAFFRPATWSPDGSQLAYLVNTDRFGESTAFGGSTHILELWTTEVSAGLLQNAQLRGDVYFGEGCGGGGRSASAEIYEVEGGFAYGYLAGIVAWSADDIILFSNNCGSRGVGRFDLATGAELDAYTGGLRSLSFNAARDQWVAIDEQNQLVLGTPAALDYTPVAAQKPAELVFFGQQSGDLYYTTLTITGTQEMVDVLANLDPQIFVSPYFDFTQPELRKLDLASATETVLTAAHGYAYARVTEGAGALFFAQVEDNMELLTAMQEGKLTVDNYQDLLPTVDLLWLPTGAATPEVWLADAEQFTLVP